MSFEYPTEDSAFISRETVSKSVEDEMIGSIEEYAELSTEYALAHYPFNNLQPETDDFYRKRDRQLKEFQIKSVLSSIDQEPPSNAIEIASAGSIALATALPETDVTSLDYDPQMFRNAFEQLPEETRLKLQTPKTNSEKVVEKTLGNWHPEVADATKIPHPDNTFGLTVTYNNPNTFPMYLSEMARVTKEGGLIIAIDTEMAKKSDSPSFYDTGNLNSLNYKDYPAIEDETLNHLGLEQIDAADELRQFENTSEWDYKDERYSTGFVARIYRKKRQ